MSSEEGCHTCPEGVQDMPAQTIVVLTVIFLIFAYLFYKWAKWAKRKHDAWVRRGMPGAHFLRQHHHSETIEVLREIRDKIGTKIKVRP